MIGAFVREVFSRRGGTGVGLALPGALLTFAAPFLLSAATSGGPWVKWIIPTILTGAGLIFLIEALLDRRQARREEEARLVLVEIDGRR
jgi:hypothetical protein